MLSIFIAALVRVFVFNAAPVPVFAETLGRVSVQQQAR